MKISAVETIRVDEFPSVAYVHVHTDEELIGLGESFVGARAVEQWVHESAAPYLLGKDPLQIERHWRALRGHVGYDGTGVENRGRAMIDIALWDLLGQVCGQPIYQLLGGAARERVPIYNTCAGYGYRASGQGSVPVSNWGLGEASAGPYEDLDAFLHDAGGLAESLLSEGITAMKIWPLDPYAADSDGQRISGSDLEAGLAPFRKIRDAVGNRIEIMVEFHGLWNLPTAIRIAHALEDFEPAWFEDPIKIDNIDALKRFADSTRITTTAGESLGPRWAYRELFEKQAVGLAKIDPVWVGGISEAKKVIGMAETYHLPIAPHSTGPVTFTTGVHLSVNAANTYRQEAVRAFFTGWYRDLVTEVPRVENGYVYPLTGPGLGTSLQESVLARPDTHVRRTDL